MTDEEIAKVFAADFARGTGGVAGYILAAITESRRQLPGGGGMTDAILSVLRADYCFTHDPLARPPLDKSVLQGRAMILEIDRLRAFVHCLMNEPEGQSWASGYDQGRKAGAAQQKAACVAEVRRIEQSYQSLRAVLDPSLRAVLDPYCVIEAVEDTNLVTE